jgi:hypothetical protein
MRDSSVVGLMPRSAAAPFGPDATGAKAEAISVLSQRGKSVDILVMFDGLPSGGPREYTVILK